MSLASFVRRPVATSLLAAGVMLVGAIAFALLPVAPLPQVDFPVIDVSAKLPGASADTMASSVATPLERVFSSIPGVVEMTSTSSMGLTNVTLLFDLDRDIDAAAQDVQTAINAAAGTLPRNLPNPPTYTKSNPAEAPILSIAITSDTLPTTELSRFVEDRIVRSLAQVPGVGLMDYKGLQRPAVRVQLDPDKVAALGLTLEDVRAVIARETVNAPKGALSGPHQSVVLDATDQVMNAEGYRAVIVAQRNGSPVRLRDVANVIDASEEARAGAWLRGRPAIVIDVHKLPGSNVVNTVRQVKEQLPAIRASLPPAARLEIVADRTQTIQASVRDVEITMMITVVLVVLVIFVFLRDLRATVVPSLAIPLSIFGAFGVMYLLGYTLDNLSLMALTIAIGFVIDDAIVVVENVVRHLEHGEPPMEAAIGGVREVGATIVSMTLSLIAVFIPILLMSGIVGRLFREFAMTVSIAVLVSGLVSLSITPMACALLLRDPKGARHGAFIRWADRVYERLALAYEHGLDRVLRHPRITLAVTLATAALAGILYVVAPKGFFPPTDNPLIDGFATAAPDVSYEAMAERMQAVGRILEADPDVEYAWVWAGPTNMSRGRLLINLKPWGERRTKAQAVVARLKRELARLEGVTMSLSVRQDVRVGGRLATAQYQYTLQDADVAELAVWADKMLHAFEKLPELRDVSTDAQALARSAMLKIDRDTASRLGVATQAIDDVLYDAFGQRQVATLFTQTNQYKVIEEVDPRFQLATDALRHLFVRSATTGELVPLSVLATVENGVSPVSINHQSLFPSVTLAFNAAPRVALGDATEAIHALERRIGKPDSLITSFQGTARVFEASTKTQVWLILAAIVVVYIVLGVLYESLVHPLTILSTLPSAGIGALLALLAFGHDLSIMGLIGIFLLIGIVKKNAIMMIDFALAAEREQGLAPRDAIRQGALLRFRPIMMTTMAALMGALPLALSAGVGAELRVPLGIAIAGGLVFSQALTLFTTPVVYLWLNAAAEKVKRKRAYVTAAKSAAPLILAVVAFGLAASAFAQDAPIRVWGMQGWNVGLDRANPRVEASLRGDKSAIGGLYTGAADVAIMPRELSAIEKDSYEQVFGRTDPFAVAVATGGALAVFVHRSNPLEHLTLAELAAILGADHRGGAKAIHVYAAPIEADASQLVQKAVMGGRQKWTGNLTEMRDARQRMDALARDRDAIAIATPADATPDVKPLALATNAGDPYYLPTRENIARRLYPLTTTVVAYANRPLDPRVREYLRYVLGAEGQRRIADEGPFLPLPPDVAAAERAKLEPDFLAGLEAYRPRERVSGTIRIWGNPYIPELIAAWEQGFRRQQPAVEFSTKLQGTEAAMAGLYGNTGDIVFIGREAYAAELAAFEERRGYPPTEIRITSGSYATPHKTFALMVYVHKDNPVTRLTFRQLDALYSAERRRGAPNAIATWGDLGASGDWAKRPVHVLGYNFDTGMARFFRLTVMKDSHRWNPGLREFDNGRDAKGEVINAGTYITQAIAADPDAIGVSNVMFANPSVKTLALSEGDDGPFVKPGLETAFLRSYPLTRYSTAFIDRAPGKPVDPKVREFLRYILSRDGMEAVVRDGAFIPLNAGVIREQLRRIEE